MIEQLKTCAQMQTCTECEYMQDGCDFTKLVLRAAEALKQKEGKWLEREVIHDRDDAKITDWQQARCSVCERWTTTPYLYSFHYLGYCPNCGARMEEYDGRKVLHRDV